MARIASQATEIVALANQGRLDTLPYWVDRLRATIEQGRRALLSEVPQLRSRVVYLDSYRVLKALRRQRTRSG